MLATGIEMKRGACRSEQREPQVGCAPTGSEAAAREADRVRMLPRSKDRRRVRAPFTKLVRGDQPGRAQTACCRAGPGPRDERLSLNETPETSRSTLSQDPRASVAQAVAEGDEPRRTIQRARRLEVPDVPRQRRLQAARFGTLLVARVPSRLNLWSRLYAAPKRLRTRWPNALWYKRLTMCLPATCLRSRHILIPFHLHP